MPDVTMDKNVYESEQQLNEYLLFHYGNPSEILPYDFGPIEALNFPSRCVNECVDFENLSPQARALDLGCAVGRASFELANHCVEVLGFDYSESFIRAANFLKKEGSLPYTIKLTGNITGPASAEISSHINRERVVFEVADAHALPPDLSDFDVVLAANLLCRMNNPRKLLLRLPQLVKKGGQLIITTPHTWLDTFTPRENWLGATPESGQPLDAIKQLLSPAFNLTTCKDMPFLIREHARKYQWSVAQASMWHRL